MPKFEQLSEIMDGYNPQRALLEQTRKLVEKWEPTGLLEGIGNETKTHGMAVLLENQARQLIDESSQTGTSANSEEWSGVALPLVRRIFGELAAQEFVSVQPMNLPSGLIFYLDFKYGSAQATGLHTENADIFGDTSSSGDASGGLYGAGRFGYSINDFSSSVLTIAASLSANKYTTSSAVWKDVNYEPDLSASIVSGLVNVHVRAADLSSADLNGVRAFELSGSGVTAFYPAYTSASSDDSEVRFIASGTFNAANGVGIKFHKQSTTNYSRTEFEASAGAVDANPEADIDIPEVDISLKSIPIIASTK